MYFTMLLDIAELSDKKHWTQLHLASGIRLLKPAMPYFGTPRCGFKEGMLYLAEELKKRKRRESRKPCEHKVSVGLAAGLQCPLQVMDTVPEPSSGFSALSMDIGGAHPASLWMSPLWRCQARLCPLKPEMTGDEGSGWPVVDYGKAASLCSSQQPTIFLLENLTLLWPMPQTQEPLNNTQIIREKQCVETNKKGTKQGNYFPVLEETNYNSEIHSFIGLHDVITTASIHPLIHRFNCRRVPLCARS